MADTAVASGAEAKRSGPCVCRLQIPMPRPIAFARIPMCTVLTAHQHSALCPRSRLRTPAAHLQKRPETHRAQASAPASPRPRSQTPKHDPSLEMPSQPASLIARWPCSLPSCRNHGQLCYRKAECEHVAIDSVALQIWSAAVRRGESGVEEPPGEVRERWERERSLRAEGEG